MIAPARLNPESPGFVAKCGTGLEYVFVANTYRTLGCVNLFYLNDMPHTHVHSMIWIFQRRERL